MADPIKILWTSDNWNSPTGFGMQTHYLCNAIGSRKDIELGLLGWQQLGNIVKTPNFTLYPGSIGEHPFGMTMMPMHLRDFKPDLVISLADWWMTLYIGNIRRESNWRWLHWLPVDGYPYADTKWNNQFNLADEIVMMSHFGVEQMTEGIEWARRVKRRKVFFDLDYIPLCVDTDAFKPPTNEQRLMARKELGLPEDAFVIGVVGRNQIRKDFPTFLESCKDLYKWLGPKRRDKVKIFLHTVPNDRAGWGLKWMAEELGLKDFVVFDPLMPKPSLGHKPEEMAKVYHAMDVHALPTRGEGFGVPIAEAMSTGLANILTDVTTSSELVGASYDICDPMVGFLVPIKGLYTMKGGVKRAIVSREGFFDSMKFVYEHQDILEEIKPIARKRAKTLFSVERVVKDWLNKIKTSYERWHDTPMRKMEKAVRKAVGAAIYDEGYMRFREQDVQSWYNKAELEIIKEVGFGTDWLEVGCGSGESMIMLSRALGNILIQGVDIAPAAVKMCRDKGLYVNPMDARKLEFPDNSFDTVYSQHLIEHCPNDTKVVLESLRVAKFSVIHSIPYKNMRDPSHRREYDEESIKRLVNRVVKKFAKENPNVTIGDGIDMSVMPTSILILFTLRY